MENMKAAIEKMPAKEYKGPSVLDEGGIGALTAIVSDNPTNADRMAAALVSKAMAGDMRAYNAVMDIVNSKGN